MASLKIREAGKERFHQIEGEVVTIGRGPTNTIPIDDAKASKDHCRLERSGDRWRLVDLESKNGTRVNGTVRNKAWLGHGDTIQIGAAEIRIGLEGGPARAAARAPAAVDEGGFEEDDAPPPRRAAPDRGVDKLVMVGLTLLGSVVVFIVANEVAIWIAGDKVNPRVIEQARVLERNEQYDEAFRYVQENADPDGSAYEEVQKYLRELEAKVPVYRRNRQEELARKVVSDLARKTKAYHRGSPSATPEQIMELVRKLQTDYAGTDYTAAAQKEYEVWFKGIVPQRAVEIMGADGKLEKDWEETLARAAEYQKEWRFREARETVDRFLSTRGAILDAEQLEDLQAERDQRLRAIDQSAEGIYYARERVARELIKNKRYDQAIAVYQEVVEKFGLDQYVRKAQGEIEKIKAMKG